MRSVLYFLLGFIIVFSSGLSFAAYPGVCSFVWSTVLSTSTNPLNYTEKIFSPNLTNGTITTSWGTYRSLKIAKNVQVQILWKDTAGGAWIVKASATGQVLDESSLPGTLASTPPSSGCPGTECPDTDSDGVCDACDSAPNDSTEGPDTYLHGFYTYNGRVVAVQHGGSANKDNGYYTTVFDSSVPGAVIGGSGGIDEDTFINAGGQYRSLQQGEKVMSTSCPEVTDSSSCSGELDCIHDYPDAGKNEALGDFEEVQPEMSTGDTMPPGPDDIAQDDPFLDTPERDCPSYSALCSNSCGGSPSVARFACSEFDGGKKNVACECTNDGGYWTSPDYGTGFDESSEGEDGNPDADDIENDGKGTGSSTIDGDTGAGGGSVDSDQDGDIDGYQQGERVINYGPLLNATSNIASRFPFSIVSTLKDMGDSFVSQGQCPSFSLPVWNQIIQFDLCAFNGVASLVRNLFSFILTAACFWGLIKFFM